jgi:hypothetical protein
MEYTGHYTTPAIVLYSFIIDVFLGVGPRSVIIMCSVADFLWAIVEGQQCSSVFNRNL